MAKKSCLFALLLLFCTLAAHANPVEVGRARKVAENYLRTTGLYDKTKPAPVLTDITAHTAFVEFYVFAVDDHQGFVLVSADDRARPILGYSASNEFRTENIPPHVLAWLQGYEKEVRAAREQGIAATDRVATEWQRLEAGGQLRRESSVAVGALLSTTWNQSPYYNELCPYDNEAGERAVTGCVATAMGQLMKYWNHPASGSGSHSYTSSYGTLTADFSTTAYDWAHMPACLTSSSSAAEVSAVATLIYHCGVAVEMDYSPDGSSASTVGASGASCEHALKNYFKYSASLHGDYKYNYTDAAWKQLLTNDLNAGRPVIYRGQGESGGHCFVCDGYDSDTNFHFNWGWSGYYDGYFALNAMAPASGMTFNDYQGAVWGIYPNGVGLPPLNITVTNALTTSASIAWSDPNGTPATGFVLAYGPAATFDTANSTTYTVINTTNQHYLLQGLTSYTQYKVAVRANCAGTMSPWSAPVSFTTAATPQPLPLTAGFEGSMPAYWQQEYINGNTDWTFNSPGGYSYAPSGALNGSSNALFFNDGYGSITRLITPMLNIVGDALSESASTTIAKLSFGHAQVSWMGDQDELRIYYRSTPADGWTLLASYTQDFSWRRDTLVLPNVSSTYQVAFEAVANYGHGVCLDDVNIYAETVAGNYATVPYVCTFGDTAERSAWVTTNGAEANQWYIGTGTFSGTDDVYSLYISSDNGMSNYYTTSAASVVFAYRDITLAAGQYAYSYDWLSEGENGRDYLRMALAPESLSLTPGVLGQWSETSLPAGVLAMDGGSQLSGQTDWQTANDVLDIATPGNYRIVAMWNNDDRYGYQPPAAVDNIGFVQNTCVLPTNLTVQNVTSDGAQLSWTPGADETQWSVTIGGNTYTAHLPSHTITGLQPNTEYTAEIRSLCGDDASLAPRRITFRTECGAAELPYICGFENAPMGAGSAMPDCWRRISSNNFPYVVQSNAHSGSRSLYFSTASTQYAVLPAVDAPLNSLQMHLWLRSAASSSTSLTVGMMSNPNDASTFVAVETIDDITTTYTLFDVSFENYTGTGNYPAIKVAAGSANYIYADDIKVTACTYNITPGAPFTETFESNSRTRDCWTQEYDEGTVDWTFDNGGSNVPTRAHGGNANARLYYAGYGQHTTRLISPMLSTAALPAAKLSFWHAQAVWSSDQDRLSVYYRTSSASDWILLEAFTDNISSWTSREYYFPSSDSLQVSFMGDARYGRGVVIDDVTIEEAPYCGEVTDLTATITDTAAATVQLNWSGSLSSGGYFRIQYGEHGFDPANGQGITINNITSTNYSIPYLPVNTSYDFYVTTICNSQQQSNGVMVSTFVPAMPVRTFPYVCSFDNPADNNQWNLVNGTEANKWYIGTAAGNDSSDPHAIYISSNDGTGNQYTGNASAVYAYREMVLTAGTYDYAFDWRCNGESTYDYLRVAVVPASVAITAGSYSGWSSTAVPTGAIALDGGSCLNLQTGWQTGNQGSFTINNAGTYRLVLFWRNDGSLNNQPPAAVDNIIIQQNDCGIINNPVAVGTDTNTIQLTWTGSLAGSATYRVEYGPAGFVPGTGITLTGLTTHQTLVTGLATNTIYDFYVSISCPSLLYPAMWKASGRTLAAPIALPYYTSFDDLHDNGQWVLLNENQTNQWAIGNATGDGDYHSLYISNDNGVSNAYDINSNSRSFAYRTVELTADSFAYSYSWKNFGENNYDFLRVALVPVSVPLAAGAASGFDNSSVPAQAIALDGGQLVSESNWQQRSGNVQITQAGTYNLVFYWRNDGNTGSQPPAAIDNVMFRRDNCKMPTNLVASRVDSTSVTLMWDNIAGNRWRVGYGSNYDTTQVNGITITGLVPGTEYQFNAMTICDVGSSIPAVISVRTLCSPMPIPYSYGFEDASGSGNNHTINPCWHYATDVTNGSTHAYPYDYSHSGWYSFYTNTGNGNGNYLVAPAVAHPANQLVMSFWARRYSSSSDYGGDLEIGIVDNPYNFASFRKIADIDVERTSWDEYFVYTDNYSGNDGFLCIHAPKRTTHYNDVILDDITIDALPDCSEPVNIAANVTDTSAVLTWHGIGRNVRWGVEYGPHGFDLGSGTFAYSTDTAFAITGLQPITTYDVYIYTDCHHTTSDAVLVTFTTECGLIRIPYLENFDHYEASMTADISPCWYKRYSYDNDLHAYPYPTTSQAQYSGSKALYFSSNNSYYSYAVLPEFDEDISTLQMKLKVNRIMGSIIQVGYMTNPEDFNTFHSIRNITPASQYTWESFTVPFSNVSGSHPRMAVVAPQGYAGNTLLVDDIEVEAIPACNPPTTLTASNIGASSATLSWNAAPGISAYRIEIELEGFSEGNGSIIDSVTSTSYTLSGLQPGYTYNVYVSSICNNNAGYSAPANISFTTSCGLTAVPYTENFDTYGTMQSSQISPCWHKGYGNEDSPYSYPYPNAANAQYPGSLSLYFYGYGSNPSNGTFSYAALPLFADSIQNLQLTFKVYRSNTSVVSVGVLTSQNDYSSFQQIASITPATDGWETHTVRFDNVTGTNRYICIAARAGNGINRFYIDDISVERIPQCPSVASVSIDSINDSRVVLSWPAVAGVSEYEVEYGLVGYPSGFGTVIDHITNTSVTIAGLAAATSYSVNVRAKCSASDRSAATSAIFTTTCLLQTVPYSYGFDDYAYIGGNQPINACWTQLTNSTSTIYPTVTNTTSYQGNASLMFMGTNSVYSCAVLPMFADSVQNLELSFYARKQNNNNCSLVVGVLSDYNDYSSFRPVRTIQLNQTQNWEHFSVTFDTVIGSQLWMAVAMPRLTQSGTNYAYIDNVEVTYHQPYSVRLTVADSTRGIVQVSGNATADGRFWPGTNVTLTATPNPGYTFGHWAVGNNTNPYTFTMPSHDVYYNNIVFNKIQYTLTATSSNVAGGNASGSGLYNYLDTAVITASPNPGYMFTGWNDGSTENPRSVVITSDSSFTANFLWGCPDVFQSDTVEACDQYIWAANGDTYTADGMYLYSYTNQSLCDIVDTLYLTINHSKTSSDTFTGCDQYTWHGHTYTTTGVYTDTMATVSNCDSIITLNLTLGYNNNYTDVQHACDSFVWHGNTYFANTDTPTFTTTNASGCDSVVTLNLTLGRSNSMTDTHAACNGYAWHGQYYLISGTYYDSYTNASGCDSTFILHLTINHDVSDSESQVACDSLNWMEQTYTQSGSYTNHLQSMVGCDSSVTLNLTIKQSTGFTDIQNACDSYAWHDSTYTESTSSATYTATNSVGCDSVVTLQLTLGRSNSYTDVQSACDSYTWHDSTYTASTAAPIFTTTNASGCDSVVTLQLTINYSNNSSDSQQACDSYTWHGTRYTQSGSYTDTVTNVSGCDSVTTLMLTIHNSATADIYDTACDNYSWFGTNYTQPGTYTFRIATIAGCDSNLVLHLAINHSTTSTDVQWACDSYTWTDGVQYTTSTSTATHTLSTINGCDSVVTLNLTLGHSNSYTDVQSACDSFVWHDSTYTQNTNAPTYTTTNADGCDSVVTLQLTLHNSTHDEIPQTVCDTFFWLGQSLTQTGDYTDSNLTVHGCDSISILHLTVNHSSYHYLADTACDSYIWPANGQTYTVGGAYTFSDSTTDGCDSIINLNLVVNYSHQASLTDTACDSYRWHGTNYTHGGSYIFDSVTAEGCAYHETLNLVVNQGTHITYNQQQCYTFYWHGQAYGTTGTYTYDYLDTNGCPSTDTLHLTIDFHNDTAYYATACDSYTWNGTTYTESGTYTCDHGQFFGTCVNVDTLYLTIHYSVLITDCMIICDSYSWNDIIYTESGTYYLDTVTAFGCDSTVQLTLDTKHSVSRIDTVEVCDGYLWEADSHYYYHSGTYTYHDTTFFGCDSNMTLLLTVHPSYGYYLTGILDPVEVCDSIIWNGRVYTESGYYHETLQTIFGCDSLADLNLQVNRSYRRTDTIAECNSYTWIDGITYTASTAAPVIADSTIHGCDSVLSLDLTINYSTYDVFYQNYCDTFAWHDQTLTQSGTYIYDYVNDAGCSSSDTLHLTITTGADTAYHVSACDSYRWNDSLYTQSGIYLYDYSFLGSTCTNVDTLYLTIHYGNSNTDSVQACESYTWIDGQTYTQDIEGPQFTLSNSFGCDSVLTLVLTISHNTSAAYYDTISEGENYIWNIDGNTYNEEGTYLYAHPDDTICYSTDTLYLTILRTHDTMYYTVRGLVNDTAMGYVVIYPDSVIAEYQAAYVVAVPHEGHRFLQWQDGDTHAVRIIWVVSDTTMVAAFEHDLGIAPAEADAYVIWADRAAIHVQGTGLIGRQVMVYDVAGRRYAMVTSRDEQLVIPSDQWPTGVYFVKVDNAAAQRVILHR